LPRAAGGARLVGFTSESPVALLAAKRSVRWEGRTLPFHRKKLPERMKAMLSSNHSNAIDSLLSVQADGTVILQFRGDLDCATAAAGEASLRQATQEPPRLLVVDMRAVTYLDSAGVLLLLQAYRRQKAAGRELRIVVDPGQVAQRVLTLSGLGALTGIDCDTGTGR
jgi:anti-anti-sigma factor